MTTDDLERYEDQVRRDLAFADARTLDYMAKNIDLQSLLVVYARDGFQAACDRLADEYEGTLTMLAVERETEADHEEYDLWLDNRDRARDMNAER